MALKLGQCLRYQLRGDVLPRIGGVYLLLQVVARSGGAERDFGHILLHPFLQLGYTLGGGFHSGLRRMQLDAEHSEER